MNEPQDKQVSQTDSDTRLMKTQHNGKQVRYNVSSVVGTAHQLTIENDPTTTTDRG